MFAGVRIEVAFSPAEPGAGQRTQGRLWRSCESVHVRVFALSDLHVDYEVNAQWVTGISLFDYREDVLILAGDVTDSVGLLSRTLRDLVKRFAHVVYVPGNHELWVLRDPQLSDSLAKFELVMDVATQSGAIVKPLRLAGVVIVPLLSWYDYSFGQPGPELLEVWMDFRACRWPRGLTIGDIAAHFATLNDVHIDAGSATVISCSHFMPRIDLLPGFASRQRRFLSPVLGTQRLQQSIRELQSRIHVYGHSHFNRMVKLDGVTYVNNALGYPHESAITRRRLLCIHGDER
jgi:predicted phosphodiesterase